MHQRLTDRKLQALKPAKPGKRYDVMDTDVRGFGVRVTDKGQRTFILIARYRGSTNPTRRAIGEYPTLTLEKAREKARAWRQLIEDDIDPKTEEERRARRLRRAEADTFEAVVEAYAKRVLPKQRRGHACRPRTQDLLCRAMEGATDHVNRAPRRNRDHQRND